MVSISFSDRDCSARPGRLSQDLAVEHLARIEGLALGNVPQRLGELAHDGDDRLALHAPIALDLAGRLGVSPDPFLMTVAVAASCAFLTPIGHKNNTLILGPGGYHFGDYWRMGLPLEILIIAVAVPMILLVWPL